MGLFLVGFVLGIIFGMYAGNKVLRQKVNKAAGQLYAQAAGEKPKRKKEAKGK